MSTRLSISALQYDRLLSFMEEHTLFARKQITLLGVNGVDNYKMMWKSLARSLNEMGPVEKTYREWEDVWDNLRKNSKTEMHEYIHASRQTGQHDVPLPSETVKRVSFIFGFYGVGCSVVQEVGIYSTPNDDEDSAFCNLYEDVSSDKNMRQSPASNKKITFNPSVRLNTAQVRYIATFIEAKGTKGQMTDDEWKDLSGKSGVPSGVGPMVLKSCWERKLEQILAKHAKGDFIKPGSVEAAVLSTRNDILPVNINSNRSTIHQRSLQQNKVEPVVILSDDDDVKTQWSDFMSDEDFEKKYTPFSASTSGTPSTETATQWTDKMKVEDKSTGEEENDYDNEASFKRPNPGSANAAKKARTSALEAQKKGVEAIEESNTLLNNWYGKIVDAINDVGKIIYEVNNTLTDLVSETSRIKDSAMELIEQITHALLNANIVLRNKTADFPDESSQDMFDDDE